MLVRIVVTALIAGAVAGVFAWGAHMVKSVPLILAAEVYEDQATNQGPADDRGGESQPAAAAQTSTWGPAEGFERSAFTLLADLITAIGFAFMLTGAIALSRRSVDWRRGIVWGLAGFAAFAVSPSLGLAPELPGMAAADLMQRQVWWIATAASAVAGLGLIFFARPMVLKVAGGLLIALPHLVGAPIHPVETSALPAELAAQFAVASLVISGLFWMVLGGSAGYVYKRLGPA